jgi:S-(hydroxymethyl)glutathione dehydrogenase/alcohol dehydrogenase
VVKVDPGSRLDRAALIGCCVPTGFGSVVNNAQVKVGDTVVVLGVGGIGSNAIQGAKAAGARHVIAVGHVDYKRDRADSRPAAVILCPLQARSNSLPPTYFRGVAP